MIFLLKAFTVYSFFHSVDTAVLSFVFVKFLMTFKPLTRYFL